MSFMAFKEKNPYENMAFKRNPVMQQFCSPVSIVVSFFFFFQGYSTRRPVFSIRLPQPIIYHFLFLNGIPVFWTALRRSCVQSSFWRRTFCDGKTKTSLIVCDRFYQSTFPSPSISNTRRSSIHPNTLRFHMTSNAFSPYPIVRHSITKRDFLSAFVVLLYDVSNSVLQHLLD